MDEEVWSGLWRKEVAHAGRVTVGYVLGGTFWFMLLGAFGCFKGSEISAEVVWLVIPISAIAVYPCSVVLAGILFAFLPMKVEWSRPWRAWLAGLLAAPGVFSPVGTWIGETARQLSGCGTADSYLIVEFLAMLSPIPLTLALVLAMTWALPPWERSRLPSGGAD